MGTDIHGVLQIKKNGAWESIAEGFADRNYDAFAILAGVRNGRGFAGIITGTPFVPISEPRGLPGDFVTIDGQHPVPAGFRWERRWAAEEGYTTQNMGDHSFTWIDGRDVERIDWQAPHLAVGVIPIAEYRELGPNKPPTGSYCGAIDGPDIITIPAKEVLDNEEDLHPGKQIYVRTTWQETYAEAAGERFAAFIRQMQDLSKGHGPENVRFVCGFDS